MVCPPHISFALRQHTHTHGNTTQSEENRFVAYDTSTVPEIELEDYLWRICDYTYISPTTLIMACIYIDRLISEGLILSQLNVFKLFFTSVRVASKVHELRSLSNKNFAVVGGVTTEQMNQLEAVFMRDFKWKLWVEHELFVQYCQKYGVYAFLPHHHHHHHTDCPRLEKRLFCRSLASSIGNGRKRTSPTHGVPLTH